MQMFDENNNKIDFQIISKDLVYFGGLVFEDKKEIRNGFGFILKKKCGDFGETFWENFSPIFFGMFSLNLRKGPGVKFKHCKNNDLWPSFANFKTLNETLDKIIDQSFLAKQLRFRVHKY
jgi:hypothetical protein